MTEVMTAPADRVVLRMQHIDSMPADIRELVHEFGYTVVKAFLDQKITKASSIRHLILQVMRGSIDVGSNIGGTGWVQSGRVMVAVPQEPTPAMIEASMETVSNHNLNVDKYDKHRLRLKAAIKIGTSRYLII